LAPHTQVVEAVLNDLNAHKSQAYTVLKRIMINNLYGVDIMEEAVEICKLRLFLKLTAQISELQQLEPLPDIDFNIRAGNTLVGYARLEDAMQSNRFDLDGTQAALTDRLKTLAKAAARYREQQANYGAAYADKQALTQELAATAHVLDLRLADEYRVDVNNAPALAAWKTSHRPFHWCSEFYDIVEVRDGFDVIVGNPPYVVFDQNETGYDIKNYKSYKCMNLYAFVLERASSIGQKRVGVIVPLSVVAGDKFEICRELLCKDSIVYWSHYDVRPAKLFDGVDQRLTIVVTSPGLRRDYSTKYYRWSFESREILFHTLVYTPTLTDQNLGIAKMSDDIGADIYRKFNNNSTKIESYTTIEKTNNQLIFRSAGGRYYLVFFTTPQKTIINGVAKPITAEKPIFFKKDVDSNSLVAILSSTLFYWFYVLFSDARNLTKGQIGNFKIDGSVFKNTKLVELGKIYQSNLNENSIEKTMNKKNGDSILLWEIYPRHSKHIIDEIDRVLAQHYGFSDEELDYIINYDIKYRMGLVGGAVEEEGE
jgi:hypothetical protein